MHEVFPLEIAHGIENVFFIIKQSSLAT